jgi:ZIP family zinc transporter
MTAIALNTRNWLDANGEFKVRLQRGTGLGIAALATLAVFERTFSLWHWIISNPAIAMAAIATLGTAAATAVGALPVVFARRVSQRASDTMLGFGAGVMLAATAFSLIVPGIAAAEALSGSRLLAAGVVALALAVGSLMMLAMDKALPHEHFDGDQNLGTTVNIKRIWLFVAAIALHNVPEGLAVGVGFGNGDVASGMSLAMGIGIQNIPEGLVVALALIAAGYSAGFSTAVAAATGLLEPLGGLLGAGIISLSTTLLPWGLGFAAGAMLFVVSHEIIPESHRKGHERHATFCLVIGFVLMMVLDTALG